MFLDDEYFMKQALCEAEKGYAKNEVPVGAVVVAKNQIIARTHNLTEVLHDPTSHAEMQAITAATEFLGGKYLIDCTLYVTLEPCAMCISALRWSQISKIVFGAMDEKNGFLQFEKILSEKNLSLLHPKTKIVGGILQKDCEKLMKNFFTKKRK